MSTTREAGWSRSALVVLVALLCRAAVAQAQTTDPPVISPEIAALKLDVDGDGIYTEGEKMVVQLWIDLMGGNLEELLSSAVERPDGGQDVSAYFKSKVVTKDEGQPQPSDGTPGSVEEQGAGL